MRRQKECILPKNKRRKWWNTNGAAATSTSQRTQRLRSNQISPLLERSPPVEIWSSRPCRRDLVQAILGKRECPICPIPLDSQRSATEKTAHLDNQASFLEWRRYAQDEAKEKYRGQRWQWG